jgi:phosphate:Na+ symporter
MLGITIALASTGTLTFPTAVALVLGENIGTTITALLAAVGANLSARRAAVSHALFNVCGVAFMILVFHPFVDFVDSLVPGVPDALSEDMGKPYIAAHIAMAHSLFNVSAVLLMLPFLRWFAKGVERLVPGGTESEQHHFLYLGKPGQLSAEVALNMASTELATMIKEVERIFDKSDRYLRITEHDRALFDEVGRLEEVTDVMQKEITSFVCQTMEGKLNNEQSSKAYFLIRVADELESIADYAHSIVRFRYRLRENGQDFSESGWEDVFECYHRVRRLFDMVSAVVLEYDPDTAETIPVFAQSITDYADELRERHLDRMREGSCKPLPALVFSDIVVAMRRIKNHSVNVFDAVEFGTSVGDSDEAAHA